MVGGAAERRRVALRAGPQLVHRERRRADDSATALFFYGSYYRPQSTRENRANTYGDLPDYEQHRNEGFGKLTLTPTSSVLLNASYRDSKRDDTSDLFALDRLGDDGHRQRGAAENRHGGRLLGHQRRAATSPSIHRLHATRRTGAPGQHRRASSASTAIGTRLDIARLDQVGLLTVPAPIAGQAAFNDFVQPLIDRYGYVDERRCRSGGGTVGTGRVRRRQLLPRTPGRSPTTSTCRRGTEARPALRLSALRRRRGSDPQLQRLGVDHRARRTPSFNGHADLLHARRSSSRASALVPTIHSEYRSQSFEVNDTIRWHDWTFNAGLVASNDTLYGQGLQKDASKPLTGFVARARARSTRCTTSRSARCSSRG